MTNPRWLDAPAAAAYLSLREDAFLRAVKAGTCPQASRHLGPRTPRWDREALDAAMTGGGHTDARSAFDAMAQETLAKAAQGRKSRQTQAA